MRRAYGYFCGEDYSVSVTADEVITSKRPKHVKTGLVTSDGKPIYRVRETVNLGFDLEVTTS